MEKETTKSVSLTTAIIIAVLAAFVSYAVTSYTLKKMNNETENDVAGSWYYTYNGQTFVLTLNKDLSFEYGYEGSDMTSGKYTNTKTDVINLVTDEGTDQIMYTLGKDYIEISGTKYYSSKDVAAENDSFFYVPEDYDTSMFTKITTAEMIEKFNNGEEAFVLTARGSCSYCQKFRPIAAKSVEDYNYTLYYLDTTTVTSEDYVNVTAIEGFSEFGSTPNVFYFKNKKVVDVQQGYTDSDTYGAFLEKNGVKKK